MMPCLSSILMEKKLFFPQTVMVIRSSTALLPPGILDPDLTNNTADDQNPSWSPDGKSILFESDADGLSKIYSLDLETGSVSPVGLPGYGSVESARWSSDGRYFVYTSDMDGDVDVYIHNLRESKTYFITNNALARISPVLSPDGNKIAFSCADGEGLTFV